MEKIVVGRGREDIEKYKEEGTVYIGKHIVGEGEESHLTNPIYMDVVRPHVILIAGKRGSGNVRTDDYPINIDASIFCCPRVTANGIDPSSIPGKPQNKNDDNIDDQPHQQSSRYRANSSNTDRTQKIGHSTAGLTFCYRKPGTSYKNQHTKSSHKRRYMAFCNQITICQADQGCDHKCLYKGNNN